MSTKIHKKTVKITENLADCFLCGLKTLKPDFVFMFWLLSPLPLFAFVWQLHLKAFLSTQLHTEEGAHSTQLNLLTGHRAGASDMDRRSSTKLVD